MALQNRSTVLAVTVETTEGTPVTPSSSGDYIAIQDDLDLTPDVETLEDGRLLNSLGMAKPIQGLENPQASFTTPLCASGTEGVANEHSEVLEALWGTETVQSTERTTTSGSTTTVVSLAAGGTDYDRGRAILLKDSTNGYSIRPVHSVSTNDLTLGFPVSSAPASGVTCGKHVCYEPANSGHQTLSLWRYLANGGNIDVISGARCTGMSISFPAGQLITANYSFEGIQYYWNPIEITSSTNTLDFTDDQGTAAATITAGFYKSPHAVASALQTAIDAQTTETITVTYSDSTGKFTIATSTSSLLSLLWNTGGSGNPIGSKLGFSVAADDTGATSYASDSAITLSSPDTPSYDGADALVAKNNEVLISDGTTAVCFPASEVTANVTLSKTDTLSVCSTSGKSGSVPNAREVTITASALLDQYDSDKFNKFMTNANVRFAYNFGSKTAGNWDAGKCGCLYVPTATITSYGVSNADGLLQVDTEIKAYVDSSGNGEVYLNFL
jgi:hypothetical protein